MLIVGVGGKDKVRRRRRPKAFGAARLQGREDDVGRRAPVNLDARRALWRSPWLRKRRSAPGWPAYKLRSNTARRDSEPRKSRPVNHRASMRVRRSQGGEEAGLQAARTAVADGVFFTRDLGLRTRQHPAIPRSSHTSCEEAREARPAKVEILGEKEMEKLGMGSLLGVGQGSRRESQLAVIQWHGAKDEEGRPADRFSSARASASTPAAFRSSPPTAWRT